MDRGFLLPEGKSVTQDWWKKKKDKQPKPNTNSQINIVRFFSLNWFYYRSWVYLT